MQCKRMIGIGRTNAQIKSIVMQIQQLLVD